ncbi:MAG: RNA ligase (ATP) [Patescibacteria group bacterium]
MRHLATIAKIEELKNIPGADKIEAARVKGWWVVVLKDQFKTDDFVLYFEIDSFLPVKSEYDFLLKGNKLKKMLSEGKEVEGIRLRTIKLRGTVSQGLILPLTILNNYGNLEKIKDDWYLTLSKQKNMEKIKLEIGLDISNILGIIKYEQPVSPCLSGIVKGAFPSFLPKTDEERIQNMAEVLDSYYMTEKLDGSSVTYYKKDGVFGVCSRNLELQEGETTQWKIARELNLKEKLHDNFAIQGEIVGEGIQKNPYKIRGQKVFFFNAYNIKFGKFLEFEDFKGMCDSLRLETVPILDENFSLPKNVDEMLEIAVGKSMLNSECEREGVVARKKSHIENERISFKAISNNYLLSE